jgi:hypothetical protein
MNGFDGETNPTRAAQESLVGKGKPMAMDFAGVVGPPTTSVRGILTLTLTVEIDESMKKEPAKKHLVTIHDQPQ